MAGIRYVTPPKEHEDRLIKGSDGSSFYMKVFGGLITEELQTSALILEEDEDAFDLAAELSEEIGLAEGIAQVEAYAIIEKAMARKPVEQPEDPKESEEEKKLQKELEKKELDIRLKYAKRIKNLRIVWKNAAQRGTEATVTAMIRSRVETDGVWNIEDTRKLNSDAYSQIVQLLNEEQKPFAKPAEPPSEDDLKKQQEAEGQSTESTGQKSSTNSPRPTQAAGVVKPSTGK
jgi:hypothetical protein